MKYKLSKVVGHQRSGSHYLAHLLNLNFYNFPEYLPLYAGHGNAHEKWLREPGIAVFYIYRDIYDTTKSIYKLRDRFGLVCNDFQEFTINKLSNMHDRTIKSESIINVDGKEKLITEVDQFFRYVNMPIIEYLTFHRQQWFKHLDKSNFMLIKYENLLHDFDKTMLTIAKFLGSDKTEFINDNTRVGWYDKNDEVRKIFS